MSIKKHLSIISDKETVELASQTQYTITGRLARVSKQKKRIFLEITMVHVQKHSNVSIS